MAPAVHVAVVVAGSAEHRGVADDLVLVIELRRNGHAALVAGHGVPYGDLEPRPVEHESEAVAAAEEAPALVAAQHQGEVRGGDAVGRVQRGSEGGDATAADEEAEERGFPVAGAEAAEETGV